MDPRGVHERTSNEVLLAIGAIRPLATCVFPAPLDSGLETQRQLGVGGQISFRLPNTAGS